MNSLLFSIIIARGTAVVHISTIADGISIFDF